MGGQKKNAKENECTLTVGLCTSARLFTFTMVSI